MTSMNARLVHAAAEQPLLYTQPMVALKNNQYEVVGYEALARFMIDGVTCEPSSTLRLIKESGTLPRFDRTMVLATVVELARRAVVHGTQVPIHVNVSQETLADVGFASYVLEVLRFNSVPPRLLVIEIVEGGSFWLDVNIMRTLSLLEQSGVNVAIDDFPNYNKPAELLYQLRFEHVKSRILKLDRTYVRRVIECGERSELIEKLAYYVWLTRKRNIRLVAEGVETPALRTVLERVGVTHMQGYLFGRPQLATLASNDWGIVPLVRQSHSVSYAA